MSKRSRACEIPQKVKEKVWHRDDCKCVCCKKWVPIVCANAHYKKRSQGGLGIEENTVTLCPECHYEEDFGSNTKLYEDQMRNHLKEYYGDSWSEEKLIYKKY